MLAEKAVAAIALLLIAFLPEKYLAFFVIPEVQLIIGTLVVIYILVFDALAGLMFGAALLLAYLRVYASKYGIRWNPSLRYPGNSLVREKAYVTPEFLEKAQNNVVDADSFKHELKGIHGVYGEAVYGAQALGDGALPGYDKLPLGEEVSFKR